MPARRANPHLPSHGYVNLDPDVPIPSIEPVPESEAPGPDEEVPEIEITSIWLQRHPSRLQCHAAAVLPHPEVLADEDVRLSLESDTDSAWISIWCSARVTRRSADKHVPESFRPWVDDLWLADRDSQGAVWKANYTGDIQIPCGGITHVDPQDITAIRALLNDKSTILFISVPLRHGEYRGKGEEKEILWR